MQSVSVEAQAPSSLNRVLLTFQKAGDLFVDLADQAVILAGLVAEHRGSRLLAGSMGRRAELLRQVGRALRTVAPNIEQVTLVNDAILALDAIAVDVELAGEVGSEVKLRNQVARARLAVTVAGSAIDDARKITC